MLLPNPIILKNCHTCTNQQFVETSTNQNKPNLVIQINWPSTGTISHFSPFSCHLQVLQLWIGGWKHQALSRKPLSSFRWQTPKFGSHCIAGSFHGKISRIDLKILLWKWKDIETWGYKPNCHLGVKWGQKTTLDACIHRNSKNVFFANDCNGYYYLRMQYL